MTSPSYTSPSTRLTQKLRHKWEIWGDGVRLVILDSPYRLLVEPLLQYIDHVDAQRQPNEIITVVVPEFVPKHRWQTLLHTQTALTLRLALRSKPGIIVMDVPYQLDQNQDKITSVLLK